MEKTVAFVTLGCKLNFSESSALARIFEQGGYTQVAASAEAEIYIINTCTVTEHSDKKCRNIIRRTHKLHPNAKIIVTGCYVQLKPDEIMSLEGVTAVLGAQYKGEIFNVATGISLPGKHICDITSVENLFPAYSSGERTRSFLKIQDGCDYRCSYCTIPAARGKSRNLPISSIIRQAEEIAAKGIKEVVLTGVNTGDFGKTTGEKFIDLLKRLNEVGGIERYRISSIEPNLLSEEIIDWITSGTKFLPHFHIPLQSGCDKILKRMHRRYTTKTFKEKIDYIRDKMGEYVFLGIDVIVGFPGESDEDFQETYHFLEKIRPAFIHIFPYSRRAGTEAAAMPEQVQESVKTTRAEALERLCEKLHTDFCKKNKGRTEQVLFESTVKGGKISGYTSNYIRVEAPCDKALIGQIVSVVI